MNGASRRIALGIAMLFASGAIAMWAYTHGGVKAAYVGAVGPAALGVIAWLRGISSTEERPTLISDWSLSSDPSDLPLDAGEGEGEGEGMEQPWNVGEAIGVALLALRHRPLAVALGYAVPHVAIYGLGLGGYLALGKGYPRGWVVGGGVVLYYGLLAVSLAAMYEASLACVRRRPIAPGIFSRALVCAPRVLGLHLLTLVCAIIPTGLVGVALASAPFFVVDENASFVVAIRKSWKTSGRSLGTLWVYHLAFAPCAALAWVLPLAALAIVPLYVLGLGYAYTRATGRGDVPWLQPEFSSQSIRTFLQVTFLALVGIFMGLALWVTSLPSMHGSAWSLRDTAIRATTILIGVAVVIVLLSVLLPYLLDRLEGRAFSSYVAARHVRSQKSGFLTVISILAICGVSISSCALSSVVSVMGGFSQDLKRKILGNNAHMVVDTTSGSAWGAYDETLANILRAPGVTGATPVVRGEVMASSASNLAGVIVTGIDPSSIGGVLELARNIEVGRMEYLEDPEKLAHLPADEVVGIGPGGEAYYRSPGLPALEDDADPSVAALMRDARDKPVRPGVILGRELAKNLHLYVGDEVTLVSPLGDLGPMGVMPRTKRFRVAAIFYSGMYEYDASFVYTQMSVAQEYFQTGNQVSAIEVKVDDAERAELLAPGVVRAVGRPDLRVRDWREINHNLFSALKLERFATFAILSIAIGVACFCIVCTLLLMVTEKGKEIAILKAMGASDLAILRTFMMEGVILGAIGTVFGVATGLALCTGLSWFGLRLDPDVYYIDRLPISVNAIDFVSVALASLALSTMATILPAAAASRLRPVDGLRYE